MTAVGYVMGGPADRAAEREAAAGLYPRMEYMCFLDRIDSVLIDASAASPASGARARALRRLAGKHVDIADTALSLRPAPSQFIATGEDVGIRLVLLAILKRNRRPITIITHGSYFASPKFQRLMRAARVARNVKFCGLSQTLCDRLVSDFGVPAERVFNASYGIDLDFFSPSGALGTTGDAIVSAGLANRDYRTLIKATEGLGEHVRIAAGSTWHPEPLDVEPADVPSHVTVAPAQYLELRDLYERARVVVVPLRPGDHACGYSVIVEAMAMGKPVVATRTRAFSDFIVEGETGFYVEPGDAAAMRERIALLLADRDLAERMGRAGRERAERLFSVESYGERLATALGVADEPVAMVEGPRADEWRAVNAVAAATSPSRG